EFWQNWPKGIMLSADEIRIGICPDFPDGTYDGHPLAEECKLYYYLREGKYTFKVGVARTHELTLLALDGEGAPDTASLNDFFAAAERPLLVQFSPEYLSSTRVK